MGYWTDFYPKTGKIGLLDDIKKYKLSLNGAPEEVTKDKEVVLAMVTKDANNLYYAHEDLQTDRDFIKQAVQCHSDALGATYRRYWDDEEVASLAVSANGLALRHVSSRLQGDKRIVLKAMAYNPNLLMDASDSLRDDESFILNEVQPTLTGNIQLKRTSLSDRLYHEIGNNDIFKYLRAKQATQSLEAKLEHQYGPAKDDEPEEKPRFKI